MSRLAGILDIRTGLVSRIPARSTPHTRNGHRSRFERSTLPEHKGTRTVVLRFLKIITPVDCVIPLYDGYLCWPKEGELLQKYILKSFPKSDIKVWSFDIDKSTVITTKRGFQLLWDT